HREQAPGRSARGKNLQLPRKKAKSAAILPLNLPPTTHSDQDGEPKVRKMPPPGPRAELLACARNQGSGYPNPNQRSKIKDFIAAYIDAITSDISHLSNTSTQNAGGEKTYGALRRQASKHNHRHKEDGTTRIS